jgi:hypothetical protein
VRTRRRVFDPERSLTEVATDTAVRLFGGGPERTARSAAGAYEFTGLPEGPYRIEIQVPEGYTTYSTSREVQLPNRRACAQENFYFSPNGRIAGRLVGPDGSGLSGVTVEVTPPDARPHPSYGLAMDGARTDGEGFFELRNLPPGRYIAGVNLKDLPSKYNPYARAVYPGAHSDPHVIELALGQAVDLGVWHMPPPLAVVRVAGILTRRDGTPVAGVFVGAWDRTGYPVESARGAGSATSGNDGRFILELRQGRVYTFTARDKQSKIVRISGPRIDTGRPVPELIRIVVLDDQPE